MLHLLYPLLATARSILKSQRELAPENLALRQQLAILHRKSKRRKCREPEQVQGLACTRVTHICHNAPRDSDRSQNPLIFW
jgi:Flp pilus assembly protein TadD